MMIPMNHGVCLLTCGLDGGQTANLLDDCCVARCSYDRRTLATILQDLSSPIRFARK